FYRNGLVCPRQPVILIYFAVRSRGNRLLPVGIKKAASIRQETVFMDRRIRYVLHIVGLMILAFSANLFAQRPNPTPTPEETTGQIKTFEVRLPVTVNDKKKNLISGLTKDDFAIFEDGVQQEITSFTSDKRNPPVYVGVLMDTSPSTAGKLGF